MCVCSLSLPQSRSCPLRQGRTLDKSLSVQRRCMRRLRTASALSARPSLGLKSPAQATGTLAGCGILHQTAATVSGLALSN